MTDGARVPSDQNCLPEFEAPPLIEVMLGIQFQSPSNFEPIKAYEVWKLFAEKFPVVRQHPPLAPQFETFGSEGQIPPGVVQFRFAGAGGPIRYWFEAPGGDDLIQFQNDRLFHNWRKVGPDRVDYPRFETIIVQFEHELRTLESYFQGLGNERIFVTQCELAYNNNITQETTSPVAPQEWLTFVPPDQWPMEEFNFSATRVITRPVGSPEPYGRFYRESATAIDRYGRRVVTFNLTMRGLPATNDIAGALDFMKEHRYMIAQEFIRGTTKRAHEIWKRRQ